MTPLLLAALLAAEPPTPVVAPRPAPSFQAPQWLPLVGVTVVVGGTVFLWNAHTEHQRLTSAPVLTTEQRLSARTWGEFSQAAGWSLIGLGAAAVVTGVTLLALPRGARLTFALGPSGGSLGLEGRLP